MKEGCTVLFILLKGLLHGELSLQCCLPTGVEARAVLLALKKKRCMEI